MTVSLVQLSFPLVNIKSALDHLLTIQTGVALAIATLGQAGVFGEPTALDGVADIFLALMRLLDNPCSDPAGGVDTTVVFNGACDHDDHRRMDAAGE